MLSRRGKRSSNRQHERRDVVYTPVKAAKSIIDRFKPSGVILDPCIGDGAFYHNIPNCLGCEIKQGKDFFAWTQRVDWLIGNPPYSIFNAWMRHSYRLADNIVYLVPIAKIFSSRARLLEMENYGGLVEIYSPWQGRELNFDFGWAVGAVYVRRGYRGEMKLNLHRDITINKIEFQRKT